jgi:hypothetical protein
MDSEYNKSKAIFFLIFLIAIIIVLVSIVFIVVRFFNQRISNTVEDTTVNQEQDEDQIDNNNVQPDKQVINRLTIKDSTQIFKISKPKHNPTNQQISYNFVISNVRDEIITPIIKEELEKLEIPTLSNLSRIKIDQIGVDVPVIGGSDGDRAVDKGWWLYPASKDEGEKILLGHRRYWGFSHPYSAWQMDTLPIGAMIKVIDKNNNEYIYEVVSQSVKDGEDISIFRPSTQDLIKIITCSTFNGTAGSSEFRHVTIARRLS